MDPNWDPEPRIFKTPFLLGAGSFLLVVISLYLLGSANESSRFAGLSLIWIAGVLAWLGERSRYRQERSRPTNESRSYYIAIAFAITGLLAYFIAPEDRTRILRHVLVFVGRALARV